jgi:chitodextrinase
MGTDVKLSSEFTIIYGGEVIAYCTDFTIEKNKEIIDITKLGDTWKNKKVDTKDFNVSFNGMITRGDTVTASLWDPTTAYSAGDYVVLAGKAWEAQGSTTGDNPTTDDGTNWLETSAWDSGTTYAAGDLVYITSVLAENRIYKSLQGSNLNQDPLTETAYWERLETNYESLLNELKNNDTEVVCTIKPTATDETYYVGSGVLTSLSSSIAQGDKATFAGSFEGSGELSQGLLEYIANGDFTSSITSWVSGGGTTLSWESSFNGRSCIKMTHQGGTEYINQSVLAISPIPNGPCRLSFYYYIPSSNTTLDGFRSRTVGEWFDVSEITAVQDAWTLHTVDKTLSAGVGTDFRIYPYAGSSPGSGTAGDVMYIDSVSVVPN